MAISNGLPSPTLQFRSEQTSENPRGFSIRFVFTKLDA